jgi:hypothetical protein
LSKDISSHQTLETPLETAAFFCGLKPVVQTTSTPFHPKRRMALIMPYDQNP